MSRSVLVLTQTDDLHIQPVAQALQRVHQDVSLIRCDLSDFPAQIQLSATLDPSTPGWQGRLTFGEKHYELQDIQSIWYRRPKLPEAPKTYLPPVRAFLNLENLRGFVGVLSQMTPEGPVWVSPRECIQAAELKPAQVCAAQNVGLRVPRTLITNDPEVVSQFADRCQGTLITKAIARGIIDPENQFHLGPERFLYTSHVAPEHLNKQDLEGVRACAHLFQEKIAKAMDLRVVIIGQQVFTVGIHAHHEDASLDWRRSYQSLSSTIEQLPQSIEDALVRLVRHFGLQYSSMDLLLTPEGEYVFLEQNPNGQFYWLEPPTGLPMAEAMANLLARPQEYGL